MIASGKWEKSLRWLVGLYALALLLSISAMDFFNSLIVLTVVALAISNWRKGRPSPFMGIGSGLRISGMRIGLDWWILGFFVVVILGLLLNASEGALVLQRLTGLTWILVLYGVVAAIRIAEPTERVLVPSAIVLIVVSLYSLGISLIGYEPIGGVRKIHRVGEIIRTGGALGSPMTLAQSYGQVFAMVTGLLFVYFQRRQRAWMLLGVCAFLLGLTLIFTFTRGVWLGMAAAVVLMAFLRGKKFGAAIIGIGVVSILLAIVGSSALRDRLTQVTDVDRSYDSNRFALWQGNWEMWKDHPLFGVGYNENSRRIHEYFAKMGFPEDQYTSHAHNQYLQTLAGTGLVGFILFYGVLFGIYAMAFRAYYRLPEAAHWQKGLMLGSIGAMTCFFIGGITEANFADSEVSQVWGFTAALVVWIHHTSQRHVKSTTL